MCFMVLFRLYIYSTLVKYTILFKMLLKLCKFDIFFFHLNFIDFFISTFSLYHQCIHIIYIYDQEGTFYIQFDPFNEYIFFFNKSCSLDILQYLLMYIIWLIFMLIYYVFHYMYIYTHNMCSRRNFLYTLWSFWIYIFL